MELILADASFIPGAFSTSRDGPSIKTRCDPNAALFPILAIFLRHWAVWQSRAVVRKKGHLLIPQAAVSDLQGSYQVYVVGCGRQDRHPARVKLGGARGTMWIIGMD